MTRYSSVLLLAVYVWLSGCSAGEEPQSSAETAISEAVIQANTLGTAYLGQQEWQQAADAFTRGLDERQDDPLLLSNLAVALLQDGRPDEAESALRAAIAADPAYPYAQFNLGLLESNRGNFEAAAAHFEIVAAEDADDPFTQYYLGISYGSLDRGEDAVAAFRRALQTDPDHVSSLYALGRALVTQGNAEEGRELLTRSQDIRARSGLDLAVGSQYGEQGPYALGVDYPGDVMPAPAATAVSFRATDRTAARAWALARRSPGNFPALVVAQDQGLGTIAVDGAFESMLTAQWADAGIVALTAGDTDNDQVVEVLALVEMPGEGIRLELIEQSEDGGFSAAGELPLATAIEMPPGLTAADLLLVDREHDGDLDIFACWSPAADASCAFGTNDGAGNFDFTDSAAHGFDLAFETGVLRLGLSDIDNDRDIDLLVAESQAIHVLLNQRDGTFLPVSDEAGLVDVGQVADIAIADVNKDGWMDLVVGGAQGLQVYPNRRGRFEAPLSVAGMRGVDAVVVADADNDGFLDLFASGAGATRAFRNLGAGEWSPADEWLSGLAGAVPAAALDADGDGDLDLVDAGDDGVGLLLNEGGNERQWVAIESHGVGDNYFGVGSKVEVLAGSLRQKFEVTNPLPVHAGLGSRAQVDSVRHLWPSGVLQDEVLQASGAALEIEQLDRKGTSCPILYVWRDGEWQFQTDFLGGSAIGYQQAPGVFGTPDTDEYIKLEQAPSVDSDGFVRLRVNNQLQEIIWFDQLQLVAVDHPAGTDVFPNERLMPGPPWPEFELFVSDDLRDIRAATDAHDGRSWTEALAASDGAYVENFDLLRFKGYASDHTLELDLGDFDPADRVVLLLEGWIDYADSSANVAAAQAGHALQPPVLTVADGHGGWRDTGHLMGFPAGLPKTMAVELTGLFTSEDHRVRIATNMRIYWDRARILVGGDDLEYQVTRVSPAVADLRYGGFPAELKRPAQTPYRYDPTSVSLASPWSAHVGAYTAFGDVTAIVEGTDDVMVTTRSGDEIELQFHVPEAPADGFERTYLLFADGFGKDMDANSAANATVGPMPFHGMPVYPYGDEITPPVDNSQTMTRTVTPSDRGWSGAVPLPLAASLRGDDATR